MQDWPSGILVSTVISQHEGPVSDPQIDKSAFQEVSPVWVFSRYSPIIHI